MASWWFARHGESVANRDGWLAGWVDAPLTETGRAQALSCAAGLRDLPIRAAWSSDLTRAATTLDLLLSERPDVARQHTSALRERHLGAWESASVAELRATGRHARLLTWDEAPPGGESHADVHRRATSFLATLDPDVPTLVVSHAGVLRAVLGVLDGLAPEVATRWRIGNCELLERRIDRDTWRKAAP